MHSFIMYTQIYMFSIHLSFPTCHQIDLTLCIGLHVFLRGRGSHGIVTWSQRGWSHKIESVPFLSSGGNGRSTHSSLCSYARCPPKLQPFVLVSGGHFEFLVRLTGDWRFVCLVLPLFLCIHSNLYTFIHIHRLTRQVLI